MPIPCQLINVAVYAAARGRLQGAQRSVLPPPQPRRRPPRPQLPRQVRHRRLADAGTEGNKRTAKERSEVAVQHVALFLAPKDRLLGEFRGHTLLEACRQADVAKAKKALTPDTINFKVDYICEKMEMNSLTVIISPFHHLASVLLRHTTALRCLLQLPEAQGRGRDALQKGGQPQRQEQGMKFNAAVERIHNDYEL